MRRVLLGVSFILLLTGSAWAALHFPALTGRVVDQALILSLSAKQSLEQTLANYEAQSTNQVVVVTLRSLEGVSIEDYGYQLGRSWGIGQKDKNNGVLLIVAPKERKVRIEVGYGLEGTLTDALSSQIIQTVILPDFRAGHMETGVIEGTTAIINTLSGKPAYSISPYAPAVSTYAPAFRQQQPNPLSNVVFIIFLIIILLFRLVFPVFGLFGMRGFSSGSGGFGGGFSGGGGGFGGGGASGGW